MLCNKRLNSLYMPHISDGYLQAGAQSDTPTVDTAEQVYISSLALLKVNIIDIVDASTGRPAQLSHQRLV